MDGWKGKLGEHLEILGKAKRKFWISLGEVGIDLRTEKGLKDSPGSAKGHMEGLSWPRST